MVDEALAAARALLTFEFVCKLEELPEGARRCVLLPSSKRSVMLLNLRGQIYCMDQACYRKLGLGGGSVAAGDGVVTASDQQVSHFASHAYRPRWAAPERRH